MTNEHSNASNEVAANHAETDAIAQLLHLAGHREPVNPERTERVRQAVYASWQQQLKHRKARRNKQLTFVSGLMAASLLLGLVWLQSPSPLHSPIDYPDIEISKQYGLAYIQASQSLTKGQAISFGQKVSTLADSGLTLSMPNGQSLRMDASTEIVLVRPDKVELKKGAIYYDSGYTSTDSHIEIWTPLGLSLIHI